MENGKQKSRNTHSWSVEFSSPFRELRFNRQNPSWGINFTREHPMDGESYSRLDTRAEIRRDSAFGTLTGLNFSTLKTNRQIGILPYATLEPS